MLGAEPVLTAICSPDPLSAEIPGHLVSQQQQALMRSAGRERLQNSPETKEPWHLSFLVPGPPQTKHQPKSRAPGVVSASLSLQATPALSSPHGLGNVAGAFLVGNGGTAAILVHRYGRPRWSCFPSAIALKSYMVPGTIVGSSRQLAGR
ncbi:uncharacterized protein LOC144454990 [Phascolarctos cinereus]